MRMMPWEAVHVGLGILEAVEALNTSLESARGIHLAVRAWHSYRSRRHW